MPETNKLLTVKEAADGKIRIIVSDILEEELTKAPEHVQAFFHRLPKTQIDRATATEESDTLAGQYITAGVVGKTSFDDCRHIALATLTRADVLVSLNFKHIVNIRRIQGYNGVNIWYAPAANGATCLIAFPNGKPFITCFGTGGTTAFGKRYTMPCAVWYGKTKAKCRLLL